MCIRDSGKAILIITAGDAKVDNAKFKNAFHTKAKMLTPEEVVDLVGHAAVSYTHLDVYKRQAMSFKAFIGQHTQLPIQEF